MSTLSVSPNFIPKYCSVDAKITELGDLCVALHGFSVPGVCESYITESVVRSAGMWHSDAWQMEVVDTITQLFKVLCKRALELEYIEKTWSILKTVLKNAQGDLTSLYPFIGAMERVPYWFTSDGLVKLERVKHEEYGTAMFKHADGDDTLFITTPILQEYSEWQDVMTNPGFYVACTPPFTGAELSTKYLESVNLLAKATLEYRNFLYYLNECLGTGMVDETDQF